MYVVTKIKVIIKRKKFDILSHKPLIKYGTPDCYQGRSQDFVPGGFYFQ